jgi:hypothetical protein
MQDLEQKLRDRLESFAAGDISTDAFIAMLKKSHLESYHNGQAAGPRPAPQSSGRTVRTARQARVAKQKTERCERSVSVSQLSVVTSIQCPRYSSKTTRVDPRVFVKLFRSDYQLYYSYGERN